jgi:predicted nucleotidyltransferase
MFDGLRSVGVDTPLDSELSEIASAIEAVAPRSKVLLFGSFVNGSPNQFSDIDICVVVPQLERNRFEIMDEIREALFHKIDYPIDILLFSNDEFIKNSGLRSKIHYEIAREGVLLNAR